MNKISLLLVFVTFTVYSFAQDLSKIDVNKLTPEQIEMYKRYMSSRSAASGAVEVVQTEDRKVEGSNVQESNSAVSSPPAAFYGSYVFSGQQLSFEPNLNIATPSNYVLGTSDELMVDVSGLYEASYKLKVNPEGTIRIPNVGPVKVSGRTIEEASRNIKSEVSKIYQGVSSGDTRVNVTLGNIRSIRVAIVGEVVRPGTYTLPSLATVFNALYASGGPTEKGTMRNIRLIRGGREIATIDVYQFLANGILQNNVGLRDDDVIKVDAQSNRITLNGAINTPGAFEIKKGETINDLVAYAGGFTVNALKDIATVHRIAKNQRKVVDVQKIDFREFVLQAGDSLYFSEISGIYSNRVQLVGAVKRPGTYALTDGQTFTDLLRKAGGLLEDAFMELAVINRKRANQIPEMINFQLNDVLKGKQPDVLLQREDSIVIKSLFDFREKFNVSISGEVNSPGTFPYVENMTLVDLVAKANGFTELALNDSVEIIRTIKDKHELLNSTFKSETYKMSINSDLSKDAKTTSFVLQNGDRVVVRRISGYEALRMVQVQGEVLRPGDYNIKSKRELLSSLLMRAGGLSEYAYAQGAFLIRSPKLDNSQARMNAFLVDAAQSKLNQQLKQTIDPTLLNELGVQGESGLANFDSIQSALNTSDIVSRINNTEGLIGIKLHDILKHPGGKSDIVIEEGDLIYIPRQVQTVRVLGEVFFPTYVQFDDTKGLKHYLRNAGGATDLAEQKHIFVLYPNGTSKSTTSFLGIKSYPRILPGSKILVPRKQVNLAKNMTTGETISVLASITSMAALVYSVVVNATANATP